jgi:hypothetical protein
MLLCQYTAIMKLDFLTWTDSIFFCTRKRYDVVTYYVMKHQQYLYLASLS